jgi:hypothetical protein
MADLCLLSAEIWFYREQLGLNKRSLQKIKNSAKDLYDKIGNLMEGSKYAAYLALTDIHSFSGVILKTLPLLANSNMIDIVVMAPILGLALRDAKSFATTKYALTSILDEFNSQGQNPNFTYNASDSESEKTVGSDSENEEMVGNDSDSENEEKVGDKTVDKEGRWLQNG